MNCQKDSLGRVNHSVIYVTHSQRAIRTGSVVREKSDNGKIPLPSQEVTGTGRVFLPFW